jgi:hypothetical protein
MALVAVIQALAVRRKIFEGLRLDSEQLHARRREEDHPAETNEDTPART